MIKFTTTILQFAQQGDKTGWTYIQVPADIAEQLKPGNKKSFRVKGFFDDHPYEGISVMPMGGGTFILALNAAVRKCIHKGKGATIVVKMEVDDKPYEICAELLECLADEPKALEYFRKLANSHQQYFSRWIESAKTDVTKAKRIAAAVTACSRKQGYGEMIRALKKDNEELGK